MSWKWIWNMRPLGSIHFYWAPFPCHVSKSRDLVVQPWSQLDDWLWPWLWDPRNWLRLPIKEAGSQAHQQINPSQPSGWLLGVICQRVQMQGPVRSGGTGSMHKNLKAELDLEELKILVGKVLDKPRQTCVCMLSCPVVSHSLWLQGQTNSPGCSVRGTLQARILEWVAMSSSKETSWPRDRTDVSCVSCLAGRFFIIGATWEEVHAVSARC